MYSLRFSNFARRDPHAVSIVDPDGKRWSRGEVFEIANALSRALQAKGFSAGDAVAIMAPNCAEYLISCLAATQIGLYVVPINWHLVASEIQYVLTNSCAKGLVIHSRFRLMAPLLLPSCAREWNVKVSLSGAINGFMPFEDLTRGYDRSPIPHPMQGRVLSYTSATTGLPKGVLLPLQDAERCLDVSINNRLAGGTIPEKHVQLCASMLYHGAPLDNSIVALHMGHTVALMDRITPELVLQAIDAHRVTIAYIVPSMFAKLLSLPRSVTSKYSIESLQRVVHTGAPCSADIKRRMIEWWGPIFWEVYGAAEGSGTIVGSIEWLKYPGTVGRPMKGTSLKIIGDDGTELATGRVGLIYMTRFSGDRFEYLGDPDKTAASFLGEYFTVGDVGYTNEEGFLFICDRKIDMINIGGTKVYAAEIELCLMQHPLIEDCAVIGVPDPAFGEIVKAVVQPKHCAPDPEELKADIASFLVGKISMIKLPRQIEFIEQLPRDPTGKLQKNKLREITVGRK